MHGPAAMLRLWHTVRHLKFVQVYGRLRFRLARPRPDTSPAPDVRPHDGSWVIPAALGPALNRLFAGEWKHGSVPPLWDGHTSERIVEILERVLAA